MRVVIALGGNALLRQGEPMDIEWLVAGLKQAAATIAEIADEHQVVITHSNGSLVDLLAVKDAGCAEAAPSPIDVLDAEAEGMVGYLLEQELGHHLPTRSLATLLTQVVVDAYDPAFLHPTKPIGAVYDLAEARHLRSTRGWTMARDGDGWRRLVPSPRPRRIVEIETIQLLMGRGVVVSCVGGGGIPVVHAGDGGYRGVEAVIDDDLAASFLASELGADALLLLTDVDAVYEDWGTAVERPLHLSTVAALCSLQAPTESMGPKIQAVCQFIERGGSLAAIGALADAAAMLRGEAGTVLRGDAH